MAEYTFELSARLNDEDEELARERIRDLIVLFGSEGVELTIYDDFFDSPSTPPRDYEVTTSESQPDSEAPEWNPFRFDPPLVPSPDFSRLLSSFRSEINTTMTDGNSLGGEDVSTF